MPYPKIKYQQILLIVASAGQQVPIDAETDKLYNTCTGINVLSSDGAVKFGTLQLDMNGQELFPENFQVIRLLFRTHAPFGFDYHKLNEPAGGSKLKGTFTDKSETVVFPYFIIISLRLENIEPSDAGKI